MTAPFFSRVPRVWLPALAFPPLLAAVLAVLIVRGLTIEKAACERAAVVILAVAVLVAAGRALVVRRPYFLWLTAFAANLLGREIDYEHSSIVVYLVLVALLAIAWRWYEHLEEYLGTSLVGTLLASVFVTYAITNTVDLNWWVFIPYEPLFGTPLEELLELVGHGFVLALALVPGPAFPRVVAR